MGYNSLDEQVAPFLTQLKSSGITLNNYYSQEMCTPSRAALMTGRYPIRYGWQFGVVNSLEDTGLGLNETTIADALNYFGGYTTHMIGKWHLGQGSPRYLPTARGFDYYFGYLGSAEYYWSKRMIGDEVEKFHDFIYSDKECYYGYNGHDAKHYSTHLYQDTAISIINNHDFTDSPLYLYLSFQAVHEPFIDANDTYPDGIPQHYVAESAYDYIQATFPGETEKQYYMSLSVMDGAVEKIFAAVDDAGQLEKTYFIFASDNGGCASGGGRNYPLRGEKGGLWEGTCNTDARTHIVYTHFSNARSVHTRSSVL
jgi:arylsulfatase A-like enzyme